MKRAHKLLSLLLVLTLAFSLCAPAGAAYSDTSGHWAESAIDRWSGYGIVSGDGNGFNPDGDLTRGQMAKILAEALGLTKQAEQNPFADVSDNAWYTPYVLRCYEAGIMRGDGVNANPNAPITREEAMVMLCRALGIAPASEGALASFSDSGSVASWAAPYVAAMVQSGIVNGVGNNTLAPEANISRAALMTILDRSVVQYIKEPGSYELTDKAGIILVAAGDVTLTGETRADVLVSPAAEGKAVAFDKATVTGSVTVQAEDAKVTSENSTLPDVSFTGEGGGEVETVKPDEPTKPTTPTGGGGSSGGSGGGGGSTPSHTHSWGEGVVTTAATCTTAGVKTFTCTGCSQTRTETIEATGHTPAAEYDTPNATGHWHLCTVCNQPADKAAHTYPEGTLCEDAATCEACGYVKGTGEHVWGEWSSVDGQDKHTRTCTVCNTPETAAHTWNDGVVTTPATCAAKGMKTYTCAICSDIKTEEIEKTAHTEVTDAAVAATCTEAGKTEGKHCSVCDTVITAQTEVAALGHDIEAVEYTKDETGHWHICKRCNEPADKTAHTYEDVESCEDAAACTVCGYQKAAGTHAWGDGTVTKAASCMEAGIKTFTCTVCGEIKTEEIEKLAHTEVVDAAVAATCTTAGKTEGKHCSVCDTVITAQTEVAALGHTEMVDAAVAATCTKNGLTEGKHCSVCGEVTVEQTEIPARGHTFDENDTCTVCGATEQNVWFSDPDDTQIVSLCWKAEADTFYIVKNSLNDELSYASDFEGEGVAEAFILPLIHPEGAQFFTEDKTVTFTVYTEEDGNAGQVLYTIDAEIKYSATQTESYQIWSTPDDPSYYLAPTQEQVANRPDIFSYAVYLPGDDGGLVVRSIPWGTIDVTLDCGYKVQLQGYKNVVGEDGSLTITVNAPSDMITLDETNLLRYEAPAQARTVTDQVDLQTELNKGGEVILGADIRVSLSEIELSMGAPATLKLNGHTLTGPINVIYAKELTIDGSVAGSKIVARSDYESILEVSGQGKVTINSGYFDGDIKSDVIGAISITGGTFRKSLEERFIAEGYKIDYNSDGDAIVVKSN